MMTPVFALVIAMATATGAVIGSFCATAALRLASGETPWRGRSRCDGCARTLNWAETVPVAGYVRAGGRCATCGHGIDRFHLWGEGVGGVICAVSLVIAPSWQGAVIAALGLCLLAAALVDVKTLTLPDGLNLAIAVLSLVLAVAGHRLIAGVAAAGLAVGILCLLKAVLERRRSQTLLGLGDIKLIAALALGLGMATPFVLALAACAGLVVMLVAFRHRLADHRLPFGPMVAATGFLGILVMTVLA